MRKIKFPYILLIAVLLPISSFGQYIPQFSQLIKTIEFVNPGYNASKDHTSIILLHRNQWTGFEGAPQIYALNAYVPINQWHTGVEMNLYTEKIGLRTQIDLDLGANVDVKLSSLSYLTFGLTGGMESKMYDFTKAIWADEGTPYSSDYTRTLFHASTGINLFAQNLHLGASMYYTHLEGKYHSVNERFSYFLNGSYLIPIAKDWALKPSFLVKMFYLTDKIKDYDPIDLDYGLFVLYKDWVWLGVANRLDHALIFMADFKVTNLFRLGYSYDYPISKDADFKYGSHEIRLEFNIPRKKKTFERLILD